MQPTGARHRSALVAAIVAVLGVAAVALVVLASAGGSARPVSESTITRSPEPIPTQTVTPEVTAPTGIAAPPADQVKPFEMPAWASALWQAAVYAAATVLILLILRAVYRTLREVELPVAEENPAEDWERVKADRLAEAVEAGLDAVGSGTATDAVIACWIALEEAAASAGVARAAAETPSEFTVRVLGVGGISEPELNRLAELYREARYSSRGSTEEARAQARTALSRLRDELAAARAAEEAASTVAGTGAGEGR
ncbi:MAG TPA: DUF4129 domain-containing protein [Kribbella sp.]|nr:DUF4129 domain-containing protein [Kribbella sp.]